MTQAEFNFFNTLLAEKTAMQQMTEYRLVKIFAHGSAKITSRCVFVVITYQSNFELRVRENDLRVIGQSKKLRVKDKTYYQKLDKMVAKVTLEDDIYIEKINKEMTETEYDVESEGSMSREAEMDCSCFFRLWWRNCEEMLEDKEKIL